MKYLSLSIPGYGDIQPPSSVPRGGAETLGQIISVALNTLIVGGILAAVLFVAYGALLWITSGGDKQKIDKARKTIIYAIIGIVVTTLSFVIFKFVVDLLGTGLYQ